MWKHLFVLLLLLLEGMASQSNRTAALVTKEQYQMFPGRYQYIMLGDSLTERGHWEDMFPNTRIGNRGIGGDQSKDILERLDAVILTNPKAVFIMVGTNDLRNSVSTDTIISNVINIGGRLTDANIQMVIQSTLYAEQNRVKYNAKIAQLNNRLKIVAKQYGFTYIDLNQYLCPEKFLKDEYTIDGVHLTGKGYMVWKNVLSEYIQ